MTSGLPPSLSVPALALVGAAAGLLATLAMDVPMRGLLAEGMTPPSVAAGALTGSDTANAPRGVALAVHYGSGTGAGLTFTVLAVLGAAVGLSGPVVAGLPVLALAAAALVQLPVMVAFFSYLVLPRYGTVEDERVPAIRRDWLRSATVYVVSVTALLPALVWAVG
ncbi:MAG: hypothetical protein ACI9CA_000471 [Natronomonas sp.]|jgi:hypothetical protein